MDKKQMNEVKYQRNWLLDMADALKHLSESLGVDGRTLNIQEKKLFRLGMFQRLNQVTENLEYAYLRGDNDTVQGLMNDIESLLI